MKSIWAVISCFLLVVVLSAIADVLMRMFFPEAFSPGGALQSSLGGIATIVYSAVFGVLGCYYLTARLAGSRPMLHAMLLGAVAPLINLAGFIGSWRASPVWDSLGFLATILPSAWLGGFLRLRQVRV